MADPPRTTLEFTAGCPDCARRRVIGLPAPLPDVGDDFDWQLGDYDSFRLFMMEELAARVPERGRWTPADVEVVIVEALAAALDQISDMADRVYAESFLETARRPESVRRLLDLIGYDAVGAAASAGQIKTDLLAQPDAAEAALLRLWEESPRLMDSARAAGPRALHETRRMVTAEDHGAVLEGHPLVRLARGVGVWGGSWPVVRLSALMREPGATLDTPTAALPAAVRVQVDDFHVAHGMSAVFRGPAAGAATTIRDVLTVYVDSLRMIGQEVVLTDAISVGVTLAVSARVRGNFFRGEVGDAIVDALTAGPGGFFEPGRLAIGESVHASDVIERVMSLDGVESVCLERFKRVGRRFPDQVTTGRISIESGELARCDNDRAHGERGYLDVTLYGGRRG